MPPPMPPPATPPAMPPAMPPPRASEWVAGGAGLPPWGTLIVQGATRGWMIFAIVWGSVLFASQNAVQSAFNHSNTNNTNIFGNTGNTGNGNSGTTGSTGNTP